MGISKERSLDMYGRKLDDANLFHVKEWFGKF